MPRADPARAALAARLQANVQNGHVPGSGPGECRSSTWPARTWTAGPWTDSYPESWIAETGAARQPRGLRGDLEQAVGEVARLQLRRGRRPLDCGGGGLADGREQLGGHRLDG